MGPSTGASTPEVAALQTRLAALGFLPAEAVDGRLGPRTTAGVIAFHEYPEVPVQAASHGCVRVTSFDAQWLFDFLSVGTRCGSCRDHEAPRRLEIDLAQAIAGRLGIGTLRFVQEPRFAALFAPGPKAFDFALAQATITDARGQNVDFSVPYLRRVLLSLQTLARPTSIADLRGMRLCAQGSSTAADLAKLGPAAAPRRRPAAQ